MTARSQLGDAARGAAMTGPRYLIERMEATMAVNKFQLDTCRTMYAEFKRLLAEGDRDDPATMIRLVEVSGFLSEAIPHLLNEIDQLQQGTPPSRANYGFKMDSQGGVA